MRSVRLRGKTSTSKYEPYPLNEFPESVIQSIAKRIVHLLAVGQADMSGGQFETIFADSVDGYAYNRPLGIADVAWNGICWSVKTVKNNFPHKAQSVRLISGRNSPTYSAEINNPFDDIQATGQSVIDVYNARIDLAKKDHDKARMLVMVRNTVTREFTIFERAINEYPVKNFRWRQNKPNNLEAYEGDRHAFTWQPHGSQFTILEPVPDSAVRFRIRKNPVALEVEQVLNIAGFQSDWVEIL